MPGGEEVVPVLRVADAAASAAWYARLGFSVTFEHRFEPGLPLFVGIERGPMHLYLSEHRGDATPHALVHLWVEDVDAVATAFGVGVERQPWGRMTDLTDPDGNRLRVGSRLPIPSDETGRAEAVLITGVYGAGKSTVIEDIATLLEQEEASYAAIDLDWIAWYDVGDPDDDGWDVLLANLAAVTGAYRSAGVGRFAMAGFMESAADVKRIAAAVGIPVRSVELVVPLDVVERRLGAVGTAERLANLAEARSQLAERRGTGFADLAVAGDRPLREISTEILAWLGWPVPPDNGQPQAPPHRNRVAPPG